MKLDVDSQIKRQILAITKGHKTPFYLRKKKNYGTLEMVFYTKPKYIRVDGRCIPTNNRVSIGYPEGLYANCYYHIDGQMNVVLIGNRHGGANV